MCAYLHLQVNQLFLGLEPAERPFDLKRRECLKILQLGIDDAEKRILMKFLNTILELDEHEDRLLADEIMKKEKELNI